MLNSNQKISFLFSFILLGAAMVFGQQQLSLDDAIQLALRKNLNLEIQRNNVRAADLQNDYGVAGGLPTVSGAVNDQVQVTDIYQKLSTGTVIERSGALGNNLNASINGTMVLYNGLRIRATKDRLDQLAKQSQELLSARIQSIVSEVMTQYYDVKRQEAYLKTIEGSMAVAQQNLEIVTARQNAGLANDADIFQAELDRNTLQQQKTQQLLTIEQATLDLLNLLFADPQDMPILTDSIVLAQELNYDTLYAGLLQNPDVSSATHQIEIQQLLQQEYSAQRMPTLRANAGYNFSYNVSNGGFSLLNRNLGPYAGLSLNIPIYNGGSLKKQEEVNALNTQNAQLNRSILLQNLETALLKSWKTYQNAQTLLLTERKNVQLSKQLLDLMQQKYSLRQATILELKEAQKSYEDTGYRMVNLEFAAKASEIEMLRLAGMLK